jgi:hypothetical protein
MIFASDDVVWILWQYSSEEHVPCLLRTNEFIGAFMTADARIHLYSYVDRLQDKAIYGDTDRVIYVQPVDNSPLVETGNKFSAMTSDLETDEIICEVVCAGPKNYAYSSVNTMTAECKTVCKVRRIILNYSAFQLVSFSKMKEMILSTDADETVTVRTKNKIKRKRFNGGVNIIRPT